LPLFLLLILFTPAAAVFKLFAPVAAAPANFMPLLLLLLLNSSPLHLLLSSR
jgi:hypothetical protein